MQRVALAVLERDVRGVRTGVEVGHRQVHTVLVAVLHVGNGPVAADGGNGQPELLVRRRQAVLVVPVQVGARGPKLRAFEVDADLAALDKPPPFLRQEVTQLRGPARHCAGSQSGATPLHSRLVEEPHHDTRWLAQLRRLRYLQVGDEQARPHVVRVAVPRRHPPRVRPPVLPLAPGTRLLQRPGRPQPRIALEYRAAKIDGHLRAPCPADRGARRPGRRGRPRSQNRSCRRGSPRAAPSGRARAEGRPRSPRG